jgi:hypothetical protein
MFKWLKKKFQKPTQDKGSERGQIFQVALDAEEGKRALAEAMHEPIKNALTYKTIGLSSFPEEAIPGVLARYERDITANPITITIDGKTYNTTNQEEIAEILKYLGEQLRAKK